MVEAVRAAFLANLDSLAWMDEATRARATTKATAMRSKVGYPDWILSPARLDAYYHEV